MGTDASKGTILVLGWKHLDLGVSEMVRLIAQRLRTVKEDDGWRITLLASKDENAAFGEDQYWEDRALFTKAVGMAVKVLGEKPVMDALSTRTLFVLADFKGLGYSTSIN